MDKPLLLDTNLLLPLDKSMWDCACGVCEKRQSRWELVTSPKKTEETANLVLCSMCFLYESDWGRNRKQQLEEYIQDVQREAKTIFLRDQNDRLAFIKDADRLLMAIAMTSRAFYLRDNADRNLVKRV